MFNKKEAKTIIKKYAINNYIDEKSSLNHLKRIMVLYKKISDWDEWNEYPLTLQITNLLNDLGVHHLEKKFNVIESEWCFNELYFKATRQERNKKMTKEQMLKNIIRKYGFEHSFTIYIFKKAEKLSDEKMLVIYKKIMNDQG